MSSGVNIPVLMRPAALARAMITCGVDLDDRTAVDVWMAGFAERTPADRAQAIVAAVSPLPPMELPDDELLAVAALATPALHLLVTLLCRVRDGVVPLPDAACDPAAAMRPGGGTEAADGASPPGADGDEAAGPREPGCTDPVVALATTTALARWGAGELQLTAQGRRLCAVALRLDDPGVVLARYRAVVAAVSSAWSGDPCDRPDAGGHPPRAADRPARHDRPFARPLLGDAGTGVLDLLAGLALMGRSCAVGAYARLLWQRLVGADAVDEPAVAPTSLLWESIVAQVGELVDRLVWLGLLEFDDAGADGPAAGGTGRRVGLTVLGGWFIRPALRAAGYDVPVVGRLAGASVDGLLDGIAGWAPEAGDAEVRVWARGRGAAADELAAAAVDAATPARRDLAFAALGALGDGAEAAVRALTVSPVLRPLAALWLIERGYEPPEFFDPADTPAGLVEVLAAVLRNEGVGAVLETRVARDTDDANLALVEGLWWVDDPATAQVLEALGASPVGKVAEAARRGLFKHRSVN